MTYRIFAKLIVVAVVGLLGAAAACAAPPSEQQSTTIVSFDDKAMLEKALFSDGVSISPSGDGALLIRVRPFSEHHNQWPTLAFGPQFLGKPVNLACASSLDLVLQQLSDGVSNVDFSIATVDDGTRNVDTEQIVAIGHTPTIGKLSVQALKYNDASQIARIQMVFRPREEETVYRIETIRAVYDPTVGSPADDLIARTRLAQESIDALRRQFASGTSSKHVDSLQGRLSDLQRGIDVLAQDVRASNAQQFYKAYLTLSRRLDEALENIGRLRFADAGPLSVWETDRYANIMRKTGPTVRDRPLERVELTMAGNEFRDLVFMVGVPDRDASLRVSVRPTGERRLPPQAVEVRCGDYLRNSRGEETADALLPLDGRVEVPKGESRQFWVRFNTRTEPLAPGWYRFEMVISDDTNHTGLVIPGQLEVWPFALPSYDILPNNSYAEFPSSSFSGGDGFHQAVQHMKMYGLNQIYVHPSELPRPTGVNGQWTITGYDDQAFVQRLRGAMEAWAAAPPGNETLHFIISLSDYEGLGLICPGYAFPNANWKHVFAQWLNHLKSLVAGSGIRGDQWMLTMRDEATEAALVGFEIPMAETVKSIDPSIRITSNTSTILSDATWARRFFTVIDVFQPHLGRDAVLKWLRTSGRELWVYQCETDLSVMGRDLYSYYRVYGWDALRLGFTGIGAETYCFQAPSSWGETGGVSLFIYKHPQHGLVHSRRYEMFREGLDDYRYVAALRIAAEKRDRDAKQQTEKLIEEAIRDIALHRQDRTRCEMWRMRIAGKIMAMGELGPE